MAKSNNCANCGRNETPNHVLIAFDGNWYCPGSCLVRKRRITTINLKKQPRHVLIGLARKYWNHFSVTLSDEMVEKGPKVVEKLSSVVLRQNLIAMRENLL